MRIRPDCFLILASQPYLHSSSSWSPSSSITLILSDPTSLSSIRTHLKANRHNLIGDFDDHLEDASVEWLTNSQLAL